MRKDIKVEVCNGTIYGNNLVEWYATIVTYIPEEYLDSARIESETYEDYDYTSSRVVVSYQRPETDDEMQKRESANALSLQLREERERQQFEALKVKFGEK